MNIPAQTGYGLANDFFEDIDGDTLTYTITSSNPAVSIGSIDPITSQIFITPKGVGFATMTVTADDGNGGTSTGTFVVNVQAFIVPPLPF